MASESMTTPVLQIIQKRLRRGAISRISEHCGVSAQTVKRWLEGDWKPGDKHAETLEAIASGALDISAHKTGPKPREQN